MMHGKRTVLRLVLVLTVACIVFPLVLIMVWSVAARWSWPALLPSAFSARGLQELLAPHNQIASVLGSSVALSLAVAVLSTTIGLMAARACALNIFRFRKLLLAGSMLPLLVPGTVFAMGAHVIFIRFGLAGTVWGVLLAQTICSLPYAVSILLDVTRATGTRLEEQAQVLGCTPFCAFFSVTLPDLLPGVLSSLSMTYIVSFSQYFLTLLIGGGRVKTLSVIMVPFISGGDRTLASAYALLMLLSTALLFALCEGMIHYLRKKGRRY